MKSKIQVFLSYARADTDPVTEIYYKLSSEGYVPWMDTRDILPGERWEHSIIKAIRHSDFFLVFLSRQSTNRRGFLRKEINTALEIWKEKAEGDIYLIPVRLEDCPVPDELSAFQHGDLFKEDGWSRLLRAIRLGVERLALTNQLDEAIKVAGRYVTARRSPDFIAQITSASPSLEMLVETLYTIENYIDPADQIAVEQQITRMLWKYVDKLSKDTRGVNSGQWTERAPKWREMRSQIEVLCRRLELLQSPNQLDFQSTLMWMAERGTEDDLELLLQIEKDPPFQTDEIISLLRSVKKRISSRLNDHQDLKG